MVARSANEANAALLTAGLVMIVIGATLATFPAGLILGIVVALAGVVLFAVFAVRAWRDWRGRPKRDPSEPKDPDRFWNAEERLMSLMACSAAATLGTVGLAILNPAQARWGLLSLVLPILVASAIAFLLVRQRNRRKRIPRDPASSELP